MAETEKPKTCGGFCCESFCIPSANWGPEALKAIRESDPNAPFALKPEDRRIAEMLIYKESTGGEWYKTHWYTCKHFDTETRLCKDYENRPRMCRVYNSDWKSRCNSPKCLCPAPEPPELAAMSGKKAEKKEMAVPAAGVEPASPACHAGDLPLDEAGVKSGSPGNRTLRGSLARRTCSPET